MLVDSALADLGKLGDLLHGDGLEIRLGAEHEGRVENLLLSAFEFALFAVLEGHDESMNDYASYCD